MFANGKFSGTSGGFTGENVMSKLVIFLISSGVLAGAAGVTVYVVTRDPESSKSSRTADRAGGVAASPGAVKVGKLASGRPITQMAWTAAGDLVGGGPDGPWVRISTSTGDSKPFSSAFPGGKGENAIRAIGDSVLYTTYQKSAGTSGFGVVAADGQSPGKAVVTYPDLNTYRLLDAREVGGKWQLLLRKPLRTQDDEIYIATDGPKWQHARVNGVPKDYKFVAADPNWTLFVCSPARTGGPPLLNDASGGRIGELPLSAVGAQVCFSPDGRWFAVCNAKVGGSRKGSLLVVDAKDPTKIRTISEGVDWFDSMAWSPDSKYIAVTIQSDGSGGKHDYGLHIFLVN